MESVVTLTHELFILIFAYDNYISSCQKALYKGILQHQKNGIMATSKTEDRQNTGF